MGRTGVTAPSGVVATPSTDRLARDRQHDVSDAVGGGDVDDVDDVDDLKDVDDSGDVRHGDNAELMRRGGRELGRDLDYLPHDLVRIQPQNADAWTDAPPWVHESLRRAPWVVCRRTRRRFARLAVGVRGARRNQRYGTEVPLDCVFATLRPEDLVARLSHAGGRLGHAARSVADLARVGRLAWGPTGSFGFELAAGVAATEPTSDLDIVIRAAGVSRETFETFGRGCDLITKRTGVRIDPELAFGDVGIALAEYRGGRDRVMAKTPDGPACLALPH